MPAIPYAPEWAITPLWVYIITIVVNLIIWGGAFVYLFPKKKD